MPSVTAVESRSPSRLVLHTTASKFLTATYPILYQHEASSNIILAHALKRLVDEGSSIELLRRSIEDNITAADHESISSHISQRLPPNSCFWITSWSPASSTTGPELQLVMSCLSGRLGDYPIFVWSPVHPYSLIPASAMPHIEELVEFLSQCVPPERVFSVFGPTILVKAFSKSWTGLTSFEVEPEPFYSAIFTYCTADTFNEGTVAILPLGHRLRKAILDDQNQLAVLCKEFSEASVFFPLTMDRALIEAEELITKQQVWVYEIEGDLSTICAITRTSENVSAITKVYTTLKWRNNGCAEHLVRMVTRKLIHEYQKQKVVLYVGHDNDAQKVYDRVGFIGLCGRDKPEGVEDSLEVGFQGTKRGYW